MRKHPIARPAPQRPTLAVPFSDPDDPRAAYKMSFGLGPSAANSRRGVDPFYAYLMSVTGFRSARPGDDEDRADAMFDRLWGGRANRPNPFALPTYLIADAAVQVEHASTDAFSGTEPEAPSGRLVAETLVTGLRTAGAPSSWLSDHSGSGAAVA